MSRIRSRVKMLERDFGPPGVCPVCKGKPPGGFVTVNIDERGNRSAPRGTPPCPGCGERGPTLWIEVDGRHFPLPKAT